MLGKKYRMEGEKVRFRKAKKRIKLKMRTKGEQRAFVDGMEHGLDTFCRKLKYEGTLDDAIKSMEMLISILRSNLNRKR